MEHDFSEQLAEFNQFYKQMDDLYHQYARQNEISDTALWLLYSLSEGDAAFTQRELCSIWHYSPQTLNSALKGLERQGYLVLESALGNKKNKRILLTEAGRKLAQEIVQPLMQAEQAAFRRLDLKERSLLVSITRKHMELLQEEINKIDKLSSEDGSSQ